MALPDIPALQEMAHQQYGEVMTQLKTTANGLSDAEGPSRLQHYGPNHLMPGGKRNELALFATHLKNPLIIILLVATAIAYSRAIKNCVM